MLDGKQMPAQPFSPQSERVRSEMRSLLCVCRHRNRTDATDYVPRKKATLSLFLPRRKRTIAQCIDK